MVHFPRGCILLRRTSVKKKQISYSQPCALRGLHCTTFNTWTNYITVRLYISVSHTHPPKRARTHTHTHKHTLSLSLSSCMDFELVKTVLCGYQSHQHQNENDATCTLDYNQREKNFTSSLQTYIDLELRKPVAENNIPEPSGNISSLQWHHFALNVGSRQLHFASNLCRYHMQSAVTGDEF